MTVDEQKTKHVCANPECRVAETGKCVEGYSLGKCPHYGKTSEPEISQQTETSHPNVEDVEGSGILLPSGEALSVRETSSVLRENCSRIISLIGQNDVGKTTLISSLYEFFQCKFKDRDYYFAGSSTLYAFERACHLSRASSLRPEPHTERTRHTEDVHFYHLNLFNLLGHNIVSFLFGDRPGESYKEVADTPEVAASFIEVTRSDTVTILVDGKRLLNPGERHNVKADTELILQGLKDGRAFGVGQNLAIVLTKLDEIESSPDKKRAFSFFAKLATTIKTRFDDTFVDIQVFKVAASPKSAIVERGVGLDDLIQYWLRPKNMSKIEQVATTPTRAIDRLIP